MIGIKKQTYSEQVANYIKQCILNGELSPGEQIKEVLIAGKLSISRAPVREALNLLAQDGLIVFEPQKGKRVTALTSKEILDSYFAGGVLEAAGVGESLDLYEESDFECMQNVVEQMKQAACEDLSMENMAELDNKFHGVLFSRIDNTLLVNLCHRSCQGISKFLLYRHWLNLFSATEIYKRHKMVLEILKTGNRSEIENAIREHYQECGKRMANYGVDVYRP